MENKRRPEVESNLPIIFRSQDYRVISNGTEKTTLVGEVVHGMFMLFANNPNKRVSSSEVSAKARSLGSKAKYPAQSGASNLIAALARIGRQDCLRGYYGTEYRLHAQVLIDEALTPNPNKYNTSQRRK